ncbi:MAG: hypothetical protein SFU83_20135 [Meiothermus sp.]|nr:hypothetical protein [Meiothermus sp.]
MATLDKELVKAAQFGGFTAFLDDLDDWCGTKPPRKFPPRPKGLRDLMISTVIHALSERISDEGLRQKTQDLAGDLYKAGLKQMG